MSYEIKINHVGYGPSAYTVEARSHIRVSDGFIEILNPREEDGYKTVIVPMHDVQLAEIRKVDDEPVDDPAVHHPPRPSTVKPNQQ